MTEDRTYLRTHPWITFNLDYERFSFMYWLLLGEAQSKCEHMAGIPLLPGVARDLHQLYLAKGALATTAIEGNTLSIEEVRERIEKKSKLTPSREYLGTEIDNIVKACNSIVDDLLKDKAFKLNIDQISQFNIMILKDLPLDEGVIPGKIRNYGVGVGSYRGAPTEDCEFLLGRLCEWLNEDFRAPKGYEVAFGLIKAVISHLYLAWIHPFGDGNGRTARLVELQILLSLGIPAASAHLLSNHYNQTRTEYYRHLEMASHKTDGIYLFIEYALRGFVDGLREQIEMIREQQEVVHWINYIHEFFRGKEGSASRRQKHLLIELSYNPESIPIENIKQVSPRIAEEYAKKSKRTIIRDINKLEEYGLIEKTPQGIRSRREIILAFRSPTAKCD